MRILARYWSHVRHRLGLGGDPETTPSTNRTDGWTVTRTGETETRWRKDAAVVDCFRFGEGYVVKMTYNGLDTVWQLTPGPVSLSTALAVVSIYLEYGVTSQIDQDGRLFVGVIDDAPTQVFEEPVAESVTYTYLDGMVSLSEFPTFLRVRPDVRRTFSRMSVHRQPTVKGD